MDNKKKKSIGLLVDSAFCKFADNLKKRYCNERYNPEGVVNMKKNNCFAAELGDEFMFYSAFVRSFDSSLGNALEKLGNDIAKLSYEVKGSIDSFILSDQVQRIATMLDSYNDHASKPDTTHYSDFNAIYPPNIESFKRIHKTDNYFYNPEKNEHYLIELKASGDLDNKKAKAEKSALLEEYFMLKNKLRDEQNAKIKIYFGTAYNKFGEGSFWNQERVRQFFADEELLIGRDYWNFVCNDENGFEIVFEQYKLSAAYLKQKLSEIKEMYINEND